MTFPPTVTMRRRRPKAKRLRCAWQVGGPNECTDQVEIILNGHGLCEAHAMALDYNHAQAIASSFADYAKPERST